MRVGSEGAVVNIIRILNICYWILLTALLVIPDPRRAAANVTLLAGVASLLGPVAHLLGTAGLTALALMARWPLSRRALFILLVGYALVTELVQAFLPTRTPELLDVVQNLVGIGLGYGAFLLGLAALARPRSADQGA